MVHAHFYWLVRFHPPLLYRPSLSFLAEVIESKAAVPAVSSISASLLSPRRDITCLVSSNRLEQESLKLKVQGSNPCRGIQRDDRKVKQSLARPIGLVGLGQPPLTR